MNDLDKMSAALRAWDSFLVLYGVVEPGAAFDLRGDPPQFIRDLNRRTLTFCYENSIEIDNHPPVSQL